MTLGDRVRRARQERGMTIAALAAASELTKGFISQVERGLALPSLDSLRRIAAALDVPPQELVGDSSRVQHKPALNDIHATLFAAMPESGQETALVPLIKSHSAGYLSATVMPGSSLRQSTPSGRAQGFLVVLGGEGLFSDGGESLPLRSGDSLAWNAAHSYRIDSTGTSALTLTLVLEDSAPMPFINEPVPDYYASLREATNRLMTAEGPLRLAALRQQTREQGGGR